MIPVFTPIVASSRHNRQKKKCPVCNHEVETRAHHCPTCGHLLEITARRTPAARVAVILGVLLLVLGCLVFFQGL